MRTGRPASPTCCWICTRPPARTACWIRLDRSYEVSALELARLLRAFHPDPDGSWLGDGGMELPSSYLLGLAGVTACLLRLAEQAEHRDAIIGTVNGGPGSA